MWVKTAKMQGDHVVPLEKEGATVRLVESTSDHRAVIATAGGRESEMPVSEFHATHREATAEEASDFLAEEEKHDPRSAAATRNRATSRA